MRCQAARWSVAVAGRLTHGFIDLFPASSLLRAALTSRHTASADPDFGFNPSSGIRHKLGEIQLDWLSDTIV
jgi:hypothetical protein